METEILCGLGVVTLGLRERLDDQLLFGLGDGLVWVMASWYFVREAPLGGPASVKVSGRSSGKITSVEPSTTARSMAFSNSRTFPGQL
jgi:hypothetical protein